MYDKIDQLKMHLSELRPLNPGELARLRDEFSIYNCYESNAIEGSTLTLRETALILQEGITIAEKPIKEHLEAIGHKDAFDFIIELVDRNAALTERVIKEVHSLVLMSDRENRGVYRKVPVMIVGADHTPPQPYMIAKQMETLICDFEIWKHEKHIIEAIAKFHLQFESIHPFIDGNGRTGRLLLNFELMKSGLLPVNIKFSDRLRYYDCFGSYRKHGDVNALADMIAEYETEELNRYIQIIEQT